MNIVDLATQSESIREQAAVLLVEHFDEPRGWSDMELARKEVAWVVAGGFARGMLDGEASGARWSPPSRPKRRAAARSRPRSAPTTTRA